ncbi:MAG: hypothetical protein JNK57_01000 [Planctomycetaceae bacterium]|nr:hypothetical protein [Planctomycetaceae bacterium]
MAIRHYPSWARIREQNESPHWLGSDKVIEAETEPLSKKTLQFNLDRQNNLLLRHEFPFWPLILAIGMIGGAERS